MASAAVPAACILLYKATAVMSALGTGGGARLVAMLAIVASLAMLSGCSTLPIDEEPYGGYSRTRVIQTPDGEWRRVPMREDLEAPERRWWWEGDGVAGSPRIVISISEQRARFYKGGKLVGETEVSTGREGYGTRPGSYSVIQKSPNHRSSIYGSYVDGAGNTVVGDVTRGRTPQPAGTSYLGASMPFFLRFYGGVGMHAGYLPGYPASHGCVRLPYGAARVFYANAPYGTPVQVVY
ncbi:hypothetical protein DB346_13980 [Verrucomicrobia bacterium LW23]|nr:hypothetical protein DB346_13980 [Verrucomicrobia bacterium LW23]